MAVWIAIIIGILPIIAFLFDNIYVKSLNYFNSNDNAFIMFFVYVALCILAIAIVNGVQQSYRENKRTKYLRSLVSQQKELTPSQFFEIKNAHLPDFEGIYIFYNKTRDMYYVGQSIHVIQRVNQHLTGHGNGDVYADYKYNDIFTLKLIPLRNSGFKTLNDLERSAIKTYDSYARGYNKTRGNS